MNYCKKYLLAIAVVAAMAQVISAVPEEMQPELLSEQESDSVGPQSPLDNAAESEELPSIQRSRRQAVAQQTAYTWWERAPATNNQRCYYYYFYVGPTRFWYYVCYNARNEQIYYYAPSGTPQQPQPPAPPQFQLPPPQIYANNFKNFFRTKFRV